MFSTGEQTQHPDGTHIDRQVAHKEVPGADHGGRVGGQWRLFLWGRDKWVEGGAEAIEKDTKSESGVRALAEDNQNLKRGSAFGREQTQKSWMDAHRTCRHLVSLRLAQVSGI